MRKKLVKKKIILALCLGAACSVPPVYAADVTLDPVRKIETGTSSEICGYEVPGGITAIDVTNSSITVTVDNGNWSNANASAFVLGLYNSVPGVTLQGATGQNFPITVSALGGTSTVADAYAVANAVACGFSASATTIDANTTIQVTAVGGTASSNNTTSTELSRASASAEAIGISEDSTTINGNAAIQATAVGGTASSNNASTEFLRASAGAEAIGIIENSMAINGNVAIQATAIGGTASSNNASTEFLRASADANAIGIRGNSMAIIGDGTIQATAVGGTASSNNASSESAEANADAIGIRGNSTAINGNATIQATAIGGAASGNNTSIESSEASAQANAIGIRGNLTAITGNAIIQATATGGTAKLDSYADESYADESYADESYADARSYAFGISGDSTINGNATIKATATGGTANTANLDSVTEAGAYATGIAGDSTTINGNATIQATANGGTAISNGAYMADANANAVGIGNSGTDITTSIRGNANITVAATGGSATSMSAFPSVSASVFAGARGIANAGTTSISGDADITVAATGGSATAASASMSAIAMGITNFGTTDINGDADITVTAAGGHATSTSASAFLLTYASAVGITNSGTTNISGDATITVAAAGGNATSTSTPGYEILDASAAATGIINNGTGIIRISGDADITVTATGGSAPYASVYAYGIRNTDGTVSLEKNATVAAAATASNSDARAVALYTAGGTIAINQAEGHPYTVKLTGDVLAKDGGEIKLTLNNSDSFLKGNVINDGGTVSLTLANNAVWEPVYDNRNGTISYKSALYSTTGNSISALNVAGGIVDLTWDDKARTTTYRNLAITSFSGTGGTLKINTDVAGGDGDTVAIGTLSSAANLKIAVTYDRSLAGITKPTTIYTPANYSPVSITSGANYLTLNGVTSESGAYLIKPNFSGTNLTSLTIGSSSNTKAAASAAGGQANMMQISLNHLQKRLGDLRESSATKTGAWARVYSGEVTNDKYDEVESDYKGIQVGYDKSKPVKNGRKYIGGALSFTSADNSFTRGGGDSKAYDFALYQTWIGNDGHYYDLIAKHGRLSTDYHVTDLSDNYSTADYHTWTDSLSAEYGYRQHLANGWYLEPQVELTFGRTHDVDYTTSSGMKVQQDSIDRLTGRLGIGVGRKLSNGNHLYSSLSVLHEFKEEENIKADALHYSQDMSGTWYEYILGMNVRLSDHSNGYFNVEKLFGGYVHSNWQLNAGCRWSF